MANYINPADLLAPFMTPLTSNINQGIGTGINLVKLNEEVKKEKMLAPYYKAHGDLYKAQQVEKSAEQAAYDRIMKGGVDWENMTPAIAALLKKGGVEPSLYAPKINVDIPTGQTIRTNPVTGTSTASDIGDGFIIPKTIRDFKATINGIPTTIPRSTTARGDISEIPDELGAPTFSPNSTPYVDKKGEIMLVDENDPNAQAIIRMYGLKPYEKPFRDVQPLADERKFNKLNEQMLREGQPPYTWKEYLEADAHAKVRGGWPERQKRNIVDKYRPK